MSRTLPITIDEFELILEIAQERHGAKGEPIPMLKEEQLAVIDSCLKTPFQTFDRKDLYRGFLSKAAILFYLINKNHALSNGNKRMACLTLGYFFIKNKRELTISQADFYELATAVTESDPEDKDETIAYILDVLSGFC